MFPFRNNTADGKYTLAQKNSPRQAARNDWVERAKDLFAAAKPDHFTNYRHCCECAEHDATLLNHDIDSIGLAELGNQGWDPLCFASPKGLQYYLPAMVRLTLETMDSETYIDSLLFHLIKEGESNDFVTACNREQRTFVSEFLTWLIETYPGQLDAAGCSQQILWAHDIWHEE